VHLYSFPVELKVASTLHGRVGVYPKVKLAMLEIILNGAPRQLDGTLTVAAFLALEGLAGKRLAVEKNGEIVPKSQHATTFIEAGDRLEIVVAVGGG
jgi:sulfur carrier protein